jgi:NAD(P)-dependent dehydrogenase (short-subunit alcohol dehydrogenase family)
MKNKVVVITGAGGVLCAVIAKFFAAKGARVALVDINLDAVNALAAGLVNSGFVAKGYAADVLNKESLEKAKVAIESDFGVCEILINGAGGNSPKATTDAETFCSETKNFFNLTKEGVDFVFDLNFTGTFLTTQVFANGMAQNKNGVIINISSMNAFCPLTKIPAYSAAKAAVSNFTQWLSVYFANSGIRVNAIAPGFFATQQNKALLFNDDGSLTPRSGKILKNTPLGRFGTAEELLGAIEFLADDTKSAFVTGVILPVDGGFSAFSGV